MASEAISKHLRNLQITEIKHQKSVSWGSMFPAFPSIPNMHGLHTLERARPFKRCYL